MAVTRKTSPEEHQAEMLLVSSHCAESERTDRERRRRRRGRRKKKERVAGKN